MSRAARSGRGLAAAIARHLVNVVVGVVTVGLVGRRLGAEALGMWALIGTCAFLLGLADLGVPLAAQRARARGATVEAVRAARLAVSAILVVAPLLVVGAALWLIPLARAVPAGGAAVGLGLLAGVVTALGSPARALAVVTPGAMSPLAASRGIAGAVQLVIMLVAFSLDASLKAPALGLLAGAVIETGAVWAIAREGCPGLRPHPALPSGRVELLAIGREASAALAINLAVAAAVRLDLALVAGSGALAAVAAYGIAGRAVDQLYSLAKQVSAAALPGLGDAARRHGIVRIGVQRLGVLAGAGLASLAICGQPLLTAWAGPAASTPLTTVTLAVLGAAAIVAALTEIPAAALTLTGRSAWRAAVPIAAGAGVNVAIGLGGVGTYGPVAVAVATVVGNLVNAALTWSRAGELLGWTRDDLLAMLAPPLAATGAAVVAGGLLRASATGPLSSALTCAACGLVGAGAGLVAATRTAPARAAAPSAISV